LRHYGKCNTKGFSDSVVSLCYTCHSVASRV
jgi:hypothetical protein